MLVSFILDGVSFIVLVGEPTSKVVFADLHMCEYGCYGTFSYTLLL